MEIDSTYCGRIGIADGSLLSGTGHDLLCDTVSIPFWRKRIEWGDWVWFGMV
jgi:hypothetical protein